MASSLEEEKQSNEKLRQQLMSIALAKKAEKVQKGINNEFIAILNSWKTILFEYMNTAVKVGELSDLGEEQSTVSAVRLKLNECLKLVEISNPKYDEMMKLLDLALSTATLSDGWIQHIATYEKDLYEISRKLNSVGVFSPEKEVTAALNKMVEQLYEVQMKVNALTARVEEAATERMRLSSGRMNAYLDGKLRESDLTSDIE